MNRPEPGVWLMALGQQSFSVRSATDHVLVDPMLMRSFGTHPGLQFEIYPPREILLGKMPAVTGIVLTNEHLDHFHLPTLRAFPARPRLYCGSLMPTAVLEVLDGLGYPVTLCEEGEPVRLGGLTLRMYRGGAESALCEKRVYNVMLSRRDGTRGVLFQSDAVFSSALKAALAAEALVAPECVVVTNNSQISLPGANSPWARMLPRDPTGLTVLRAILGSAEALGARELVLHASGYLHPFSRQGPYLWADHKRVARELSELELFRGVRVVGLDPWEALRVGAGRVETVDWVQADAPGREQLLQRHEEAWKAGRVPPRASAPLLPAFSSAREEAAARRVVAEELERMGRVLRVSPLLASASSYGGTEAQKRGDSVVVRLRSGRKVWSWVFNRHAGAFIERPRSPARPLEHAPFGVETHLVDFHGLLTGQLQAWELVTCGLIEHWSPGDRTEGLLGFLFAYFGEQMRPELARKTFQWLTRSQRPLRGGQSPAASARGSSQSTRSAPSTRGPGRRSSRPAR